MRRLTHRSAPQSIPIVPLSEIRQRLAQRGITFARTDEGYVRSGLGGFTRIYRLRSYPTLRHVIACNAWHVLQPGERIAKRWQAFEESKL